MKSDREKDLNSTVQLICLAVIAVMTAERCGFTWGVIVFFSIVLIITLLQE